MMRAIYLLFITVPNLLVYSSAKEFDSSEERVLVAVDICLGKRLKLDVNNVYYPGFVWRFNGKPVSEKCETKITPVGNTLICADMDWSDEGVYEFHGIAENGQKDVLLAVDVKIAEREKKLAEKQQIEYPTTQCFCSGITNDCSLADDLFRYKLIANVTENKLATLSITKTEVRESISSAEDSSTYYILPEELKGNLLLSYGGFIDFPSADNDIDVDKPQVILQSNSQTLVYYEREQHQGSSELNRKRVLMTENNWNHLNNDTVSKDVFLTMLSNVKEFYVKFSKYNDFIPVYIVLDSADIKDHGLGKVTTIEKCNCRAGYKGLSCESCSRGFYRRPAIREGGVCVSIRHKLEPLLEHLLNQLDTYKTNVKSIDSN